VNNAGGGGTVEVNVKTGAVKFEGYSNIQMRVPYNYDKWNIEAATPGEVEE
jgi:hypothetical protein